MIIKRTQPKTLSTRPSYPLGSAAAALATRGLNPRQVDASHPATPAPRGAGYTGPVKQSADAHDRATAASRANNARLATGRAPVLETPIGPTTLSSQR